jgi:hypothetical protein
MIPEIQIRELICHHFDEFLNLGYHLFDFLWNFMKSIISKLVQPNSKVFD